MKKIFILAAAAMMSLSAFASDIYVGGRVGVLHNATDDTTTANILPEIGYNLSDKAAIAAAIGYSYAGKGGVHNHSFVFDPYVRYTFYQKGIVSLFVDGGVDFSAGATHYDHQDNTDASITVGIGFKPGIAVNLNDSFSVVAHAGLIGYTYGNNAAKSGGRFTGGGFDLSNAISFGLYYNF